MLQHLLNAARTRQNMAAYHNTGDEKYKNSLPAILFNGVFDAEAYQADTAAGKAGGIRTDEYFLPSPFIGLDIDIKDKAKALLQQVKEKDNAKALFQQVKEKVEQKLNCSYTDHILMSYETPSGGLRVVATRRKGTSIAEDLTYWESIIELSCDSRCVNTSRLFFLVPQEYVFHLDSQKIFDLLEAHDPNDYKSEKKTENTKSAQQVCASTVKNNVSSYFAQKFSKEDLFSIARELEFVHAGGPALEGGRNNLTFDMAKYLRYLTGDDEELLAEIIPQYEVTEVAHKRAISNALKYTKNTPKNGSAKKFSRPYSAGTVGLPVTE